jgi:hypothetical protein
MFWAHASRQVTIRGRAHYAILPKKSESLNTLIAIGTFNLKRRYVSRDFLTDGTKHLKQALNF